MSDNSDNKRKRDNEKQKDKPNKDSDKSKDDSVTRTKSKKSKTNPKSPVHEEERPTKSANNEVTAESTSKHTDAANIVSESNTNIQKPSSSAARKEKKKTKKCGKCNANVALIGFECRCGGVYCVTHRYSNEHNCTFDYRQHGAEQIRKNNPRVVGKKV